MPGAERLNLADNFSNGHDVLGFRRGVAVCGVTPCAAQVATKKTDEDRREPGTGSFPFNRLEDFNHRNANIAHYTSSSIIERVMAA
ncbi:hypothetical protein D3C85_1605170 [compost metagenome]